jgi:hypothetical protein
MSLLLSHKYFLCMIRTILHEIYLCVIHIVSNEICLRVIHIVSHEDKLHAIHKFLPSLLRQNFPNFLLSYFPSILGIFPHGKTLPKTLYAPIGHEEWPYALALIFLNKRVTTKIFNDSYKRGLH